MPEIPPGICQCGCGGKTKPIVHDNKSRGYIAGTPRKFMQGHGGVGSGKIRPPRNRTLTAAERGERIIAGLARAREKAAQQRLAAMEPKVPKLSPAVKLYRETRAERMPAIKRREAKILESVKKAVAEADARAFELRHRGRPKSAKRLPPLALRRNPDALIAAVTDWHGER